MSLLGVVPVLGAASLVGGVMCSMALSVRDRQRSVQAPHDTSSPPSSSSTTSSSSSAASAASAAASSASTPLHQTESFALPTVSVATREFKSPAYLAGAVSSVIAGPCLIVTACLQTAMAPPSQIELAVCICTFGSLAGLALLLAMFLPWSGRTKKGHEVAAVGVFGAGGAYGWCSVSLMIPNSPTWLQTWRQVTMYGSLAPALVMLIGFQLLRCAATQGNQASETGRSVEQGEKMHLSNRIDVNNSVQDPDNTHVLQFIRPAQRRAMTVIAVGQLLYCVFLSVAVASATCELQNL